MAKAKRKLINLEFPFGGLNENVAYHKQPPETTAACLNVRGFDAIAGRLRGGQRPGLIKHAPGGIPLKVQDDGEILNVVTRYVTVVTESQAGANVFVGHDNDFTGAAHTMTIFNTAGVLQAYKAYGSDAGDEPTDFVVDSIGNIYAVGNGGVYKYDSDLNLLWSETTIASISLKCVLDETKKKLYVNSSHNLSGFPNQGATNANIVCLDASTGEVIWWYYENSLVGASRPHNIVLDSNGNVYFSGYFARIYKIDADQTVTDYELSAGNVTQIFRIGTTYPSLDINSDDQLLVSGYHSTTWTGAGGARANIWLLETDGTVTANYNIQDGGNNAEIYDARFLGDGNWAIIMQRLGGNNCLRVIDSSDGTDVATYDIGDTSATYSRLAVDSDDGIWVITDKNSSWEDAGGTANLWKFASDLSSVDFSGSTYTDDGECRAIYVQGSVPPPTVTSTPVTIVETTQQTYKIADGALENIAANPGSGDNPQVQYAFLKYYFVDGTNEWIFDPSDDSVTSWVATSGTMPENPTLIALYRGRIVLSGDANDPFNWFMSAVGDPLDFDYFPSTITQTMAVAGSSSTRFGKAGDRVTALIPMTDDLMLFGCDNSIQIMTGDPASGGQFGLLTDQIGILFGKAWSKDEANNVYFMAADGIYAMRPAGMPESMTDGRLRRRIKSLDLISSTVKLHWDTWEKSLYVLIVPSNTTDPVTVLVWEKENNAWWIDEYPAEIGPTSVTTATVADSEDKLTLFGCRDGYMRQYSNDSGWDDGYGINSFFDIGPIMLGEDAEVVLAELEVILASQSGSARASVYKGDDPEAAMLSDNLIATFTLGSGRSKSILNRMRGNALRVRIHSPATIYERWALEQVKIGIEQGGKIRRGRG